MSWTALVVDDEAPARRRIRDLLAEVDDVELVRECRDGHEAVEALETLRPDLIFLDVQMPELSGFDVLEMAGAEVAPVVVFVSAFDHHAVSAFDRRALDYLLKPFTKERFAETLRRAREVLARRPDDLTARVQAVLADRAVRGDRLPVRVEGGVRLLPISEIGWIESDGNYAILHTRDEAVRTRRSLSSLLDRLGPEGFLRIHRSYLVNASQVVALSPWSHGERTVRLADGTSLVSSRTYRDQVARIAEDHDPGI